MSKIDDEILERGIDFRKIEKLEKIRDIKNLEEDFRKLVNNERRLRK